MPGVVQHTQESLRKEVRALADLGVPGVILFGVPATKDARGLRRRRTRRRGAGRAPEPPDEVGDDLVRHGRRLPRRVHRPRALRPARRRPARSTTTRRSSATRRIAVAQADAGVDVVAPSGMMDGQVGAIRAALDAARPRRHRDPRLLGEVRVGALRPVPRRGRVRAAVRRPARLPDAGRPTRARRSTRPRSTSPRAPTWSW